MDLNSLHLPLTAARPPTSQAPDGGELEATQHLQGPGLLQHPPDLVKADTVQTGSGGGPVIGRHSVLLCVKITKWNFRLGFRTLSNVSEYIGSVQRISLLCIAVTGHFLYRDV